MITQVQNRRNVIVKFQPEKVSRAVRKAFESCNEEFDNSVVLDVLDILNKSDKDTIHVEVVQDLIQTQLMKACHFKVAESFITYRYKHAEKRELTERVNYIRKFSNSRESVATLSEVDANANVASRNIATIEAEVYKPTNKEIQRLFMKDMLNRMYPGEDMFERYMYYIKNRILYPHDEASSPVPKPYCVAVSCYPFLLHGTSVLDGLHAKAPTNLSSFCGQFNNLIFLLSSQVKGAVAIGEFFNVMHYYLVADFGEDYYKNDGDVVFKTKKKKRTIRDIIYQAFQSITYSINQPAGNRSYQSPFMNISYYDENYWHALFDNFVYPDDTKPEWEAIDYLQRLYMRWFNEERTKTLLTFPVETMAMLSDGKDDIIDKSYADFAAEMYAAGHSFFTYISDNPDGLSSCCFSGDTPVLWKSSQKGVQMTTLRELYHMKWREGKRNLKIFHNGSWVSGKPIMLPNRKMFKVTTANNKTVYMTDNHINVTLNGEKTTDQLSTSDYLMFNTVALNAVPDQDEHLTYEQGFAVGAFLGDGSFGTRFEDGTIYEVNYSLNSRKYANARELLNRANIQLCGASANLANLSGIYNNVYPVTISSKKLVAFIQRWTDWTEGTLAQSKRLNLDCLMQSEEFRRGILDGWYETDGGNSNRCYTTSTDLKDCMEVLITSLGMNSVIDCSDRTDEPVIIRGQEFKRNYPLWCVRWYEPCNKRSMGDVYVWKNNSQYFRITNIEEVEYEDSVYCIERADQTEPYFTLPNGMITHNCRLRNGIDTNEFSFTSGLSGVSTGSINVLTINFSRFTQMLKRECDEKGIEFNLDLFRERLKIVLEDVYKFHHAYRQLLQENIDNDIMPIYKAGFISLKQQFSTIGLNGVNEAAMFLGMTCDYNPEYIKFCDAISTTLSEQNKLHKTKNCKFNSEFVPAEGLGVKNYNWDKEDGFWVPEGRNCYTSYFYLPDDEHISVTDTFKLHGREFTQHLDGGVANHINLSDHLSFKQVRQLLKWAVKTGCSYFTFNVPNSECEECGYISKHPLKKCPHCGSTRINWWTRIIGYLKCIKSFGKAREEEAGKRVYHKTGNLF